MKSLKTVMEEKEEKYTKVVKTARNLKANNDGYKNERKELNKALEEAKGWVARTLEETE